MGRTFESLELCVKKWPVHPVSVTMGEKEEGGGEQPVETTFAKDGRNVFSLWLCSVGVPLDQGLGG
jgi:hypothetical protein